MFNRGRVCRDSKLGLSSRTGFRRAFQLVAQVQLCRERAWLSAEEEPRLLAGHQEHRAEMVREAQIRPSS